MPKSQMNHNNKDYPWLVRSAGSTYPDEPSHGVKLPVTHLIAWILSQYTSVEEVRQSLPNVVVYAGQVAEVAKSTLHFVVHDKVDTLIIEFVNGTMQLHLNESDVLTNYPVLGKQLDNLSRFKDLTNINKDEVNGSGMLGLPGDTTPPSRFVTAAKLKEFVADIPKRESEIFSPPEEQVRVLQTLHLLNNLDVVYGTVQEHDWNGRREFGDYTQWSVVRDHTDCMYYFRTALNMNLRCVDVKRIARLSDEESLFKWDRDWSQKVAL